MNDGPRGFMMMPRIIAAYLLHRLGADLGEGIDIPFDDLVPFELVTPEMHYDPATRTFHLSVPNLSPLNDVRETA